MDWRGVPCKRVKNTLVREIFIFVENNFYSREKGVILPTINRANTRTRNITASLFELSWV